MVSQTTGFNINKVGAGIYGTDSRESTLSLVRTHKDHVLGSGDADRNAINGIQSQNFGEMLVSQLDNTSTLEINAQSLATQFLVDPTSVNEHDVTIASTEAGLALNITTNIIRRALEAYRSIITLQ